MKYNVTMRAYIYIILLGLAILHSTEAPSAQSDSQPNLAVLTHKASPEGFVSNSHVVIREREVLLIDAQFSHAEAKKAAELIKSTGKRLTTILITHPHPDHYYGLEVLGSKFSDAEILGGPQTIEGVKNTAKYWTDRDGNPLTLGKMRVLEGEGIKHEDLDITFKTFKNGESLENTVVYIPSSQTLFVGDLASNGVHMWVGENNVENWLDQLRQVSSIGPISTVYPGHGAVGGPELLEQARKYLSHFAETVNSAENIDEAITKMKALYPDYQMPEILEGSVRSIMFSSNGGQ
jgi:glyoxylase-like metal-dependent hydrolase (beta-lactamase superfamily II)